MLSDSPKYKELAPPSPLSRKKKLFKKESEDDDPGRDDIRTCTECRALIVRCAVFPCQHMSHVMSERVHTNNSAPEQPRGDTLPHCNKKKFFLKVCVGDVMYHDLTCLHVVTGMSAYVQMCAKVITCVCVQEIGAYEGV